jgi:hypothetical protein
MLPEADGFHHGEVGDLLADGVFEGGALEGVAEGLLRESASAEGFALHSIIIIRMSNLGKDIKMGGLRLKVEGI